MTLTTWIAIAVLGPGALLLFGWFLRDLGPLLRSVGADDDAGGDAAA